MLRLYISNEKQLFSCNHFPLILLHTGACIKNMLANQLSVDSWLTVACWLTAVLGWVSHHFVSIQLLWQVVTFATHYLVGPGPFLSLIRTRISAAPFCFLAHFSVFQFFGCYAYQFPFHLRCTVIKSFVGFFNLQVSAPYFRTVRMQSLYTFCFIYNGRLFDMIWECLPLLVVQWISFSWVGSPIRN